MLSVYTRHAEGCKHVNDKLWRRCNCPKWIWGSHNGEFVRLSAKTRFWDDAERLRHQMEFPETVKPEPEILPPTTPLPSAVLIQAPVPPTTVIQAYPTPMVPAKRVTIHDAVEAYLADAVSRELAEDTISKLERIFRKQFLTWCQIAGLEYLDQVNLDALINFRNTWKDGRLAKQKKQSRVIGFFWECVRRDYIIKNPALALSRIKVIHVPTDYFPRDEFDRIIDATYVYGDPRGGYIPIEDTRTRLRTLTLLMRWSGLRIRDAVTLERHRLHGESLLLYQAKTGTPVYVPLPPFVIEALQALPWERMKNLEVKLRAGMTANGIDEKTQDKIVENISSFALYGFPESHAASFALLAYASAYLKVKYLAAFTCALLNNQPMGFYSPAVLVDDAKRHGLRVKAIDVQVSRWPCTIEAEADGSLSMRMGLGYAKGLRKESAEAIVAARERDGKFRSTEDLALRVPSLNRKELTILARVGALNSIDGVAHRRDALWQVERAGKMEGPLFRQRSEWLLEDAQSQPLQQMNVEERLVADYGGTGLTIGKHPMHYRRHALRRQGVLTASELQKRRNGEYVKTAGLAIVKQRPGTAKGVVFMSAADETGIFNIIVSKDFFEANKLTIKRCKFLSG